MIKPHTTQKLLTAASVLFLAAGLLVFGAIFIPLKDASISKIIETISHYSQPITTTLMLGALTGVSTVVLAVSAASAYQYIHKRFQKLVIFLLAIPLIFPPYIAAITYIDIFKSSFVIGLIGSSQVLEFFQAAFVLSLFLYPYSLLLIKTRLETIDPSHKKIISLYKWSFIEKVKLLYLPHLKGVILSGFLLSFLYVVSDFGAVSILRMDTITTELYQTMIKRLAYGEAAILSLILFVVALVSTSFGSIFVGKPSHALRKDDEERAPHVSIRRRYMSWFYISLLLFLTIIIPLAKISTWFFQFLQSTSILKSIWFDPLQFTTIILTSVIIASLVVVMTQLTAMFFQSARIMFPSLLFTRAIYSLMTLYYALPAIVSAFGVLIIKLNLPLSLFTGFLFLLFAYVLRFGGIAFLTLSPAIDSIPQAYVRIGSTFIRGYWTRLHIIIFPYIRKYLLQSGNYIFLQSLRELTIPLVLLPLGVNVLSVRIWQTASEGMYVYASPSIIILLLLSLPSLIWYMRDQA